MIFCENCGREIPEDAKFCDYCGAPAGSAPDMEAGESIAAETPAEETALTEAEITEAAVEEGPDEGEVIDKPSVKKGGKRKKAAGEINSEEEIKGQKVTENVYLCPDGKYRWTYEFDMLRNPTLLVTIWKVMALSFGIVIAFMLLVTLFSGDFKYWNAEDAFSFFRGFLLLLVVLMAIAVVAYLIVAKMYGWRYMVLFTMDEGGIEHRQMAKQFEKAEAIGWLTAAAGLAAGRIGMAGTGMLAATRSSSFSEFELVKTVKSVRHRHTIYVNQTLLHNQVYAEAPDFDFVRDYIIRHCTNAKHVS